MIITSLSWHVLRLRIAAEVEWLPAERDAEPEPPGATNLHPDLIDLPDLADEGELEDRLGFR